MRSQEQTQTANETKHRLSLRREHKNTGAVYLPLTKQIQNCCNAVSILVCTINDNVFDFVGGSWMVEDSVIRVRCDMFREFISDPQRTISIS